MPISHIKYLIAHSAVYSSTKLSPFREEEEPIKLYYVGISVDYKRTVREILSEAKDIFEIKIKIEDVEYPFENI